MLGQGHPDRPPIVFIPGGGATGAAFRTTPDGRPGWADMLAADGYECWVTDWPGCGRSGGRRSPLDVVYADVVDAYARLLQEIRRPVVVLCHSMGGPATWALVEEMGTMIAGVASIAASAPQNVSPPPSTVLADDGRNIKIRFGQTGVEFNVDRGAPYIYEDAYIFEQGIANSRFFPPEWIPALRASLVGIPPKIALQKMDALEGFPTIENTENFVDLPVRIVAGDRDPAHTFEVETRTKDLLSSWGADVTLTWLPDVGISGNGHWLYAESNSEQVLEIVRVRIDEIIDIAGERNRTRPQTPSLTD